VQGSDWMFNILQTIVIITVSWKIPQWEFAARRATTREIIGDDVTTWPAKSLKQN
jgi:hypothetical protein